MQPQIAIAPCVWADIADLVADHYRQQLIHVESFWEDHVLGANHYRFQQDGETVGYFAIFEQHLLVLFWVAPLYADQAQALFARAKQYEQVTNALVPTGDEFFLAHCVDNFARLEKQAYLSKYTDRPTEAAYVQPVTLRLADPQNEADMALLVSSGDFLAADLPKLAEKPQMTLYVAEQAGEAVGIGVTERSRIFSKNSSIGMYVCPERRRKGLGASILRALRAREEAEGFVPRSGCWYYNHNSKKTQERAGAYMPTRLLRFYF